MSKIYIKESNETLFLYGDSGIVMSEMMHWMCFWCEYKTTDYHLLYPKQEYNSNTVCVQLLDNSKISNVVVIDNVDDLSEWRLINDFNKE